MQIPSISQFSGFFFPPLNLWSFKTAGRQTASCLKFMKHLFNSPGGDLSWQPFTFPYLKAASLTFVRPALDVTCAPWRITLPHHSHRSSRCVDQRAAAISTAHRGFGTPPTYWKWQTKCDLGLPQSRASMKDNLLPWNNRTLKGWKPAFCENNRQKNGYWMIE